MRSTPCAVGACRGRLGKPEDLGSLCRGAGGDPGPGQLPISKGHWLPTLPFGFWSLSPQSQPHANHSPFLPCWSFCLKPCKPTATRSPGSNTTSSAPSLVAEARRWPGTHPHLPWGPHSLPLHTRPAIPHCGCCGDSMPGPDACPPLCPGCPRSWASRSRASALASQAVLPGKSMSSQGSRGPHRQGSPLGAPVVLHSPLGEALTCGGLGAPQASSLDSRNC